MRNINAVSQIGIHAEYDLMIQRCLVDEAGVAILDGEGNPIPVGKPRHVHTQKNLITNTGMDWFGTSTDWSGTVGLGNHCRVGGGSAEPAFTNTALASQVAVVTGPSGGFSWGTGTYLNAAVYSRTYTFAVGAAAGNLTEIGLSNGAAANLLTRSLFKDPGGSPVVVQVASDEQLIVNYRFIFRADTADKVFNPPPTSPTPTSYTLTLRPMNLGSGSLNAGGLLGAGISGINQSYYYGASSALGPITGSPTGTYGGHSAATIGTETYVTGSFERVTTYTLQTTAANVADLGVIVFGGSVPFTWQLGISPRMTKVAPETVKITILNKWARAA